MSFRLKTSRVVGISSLLVFLSFNLGVAVLPGIIAKKNEVDWVDIAELQDEPEVPVIIEEEEGTESYVSETVILTRSSNIQSEPEEISG